MLAVKVYSASDYKYINPATANSESVDEEAELPGEARQAQNPVSDRTAPPIGGGDQRVGRTPQPRCDLEDGSGVDRDFDIALEGAFDDDRQLSTVLESSSADDRQLSTVLESSSAADRELWQLLQTTAGDGANLPTDAATTAEDYFATEKGRST